MGAREQLIAARAGARAPRADARRAGGARRRASAARAAVGAPHARALPRRPPGRRARGLPAGGADPQRGDRHRARGRAGQALERRVLDQDAALEGAWRRRGPRGPCWRSPSRPVARARSPRCRLDARPRRRRRADRERHRRRRARRSRTPSERLQPLRRAAADIRNRCVHLRRSGRRRARLAASTTSRCCSRRAARAPKADAFAEPLAGLLRAAAADVASSPARSETAPRAVRSSSPFAGHEHDWAALEVGAWLARPGARR